MLPLLFARLVHYYGTDAKLRVFRYERWIPAKWMELHQLYMRARRARRRPRRRRAVERRAQRDAMDGRAGVPVRAADPPAQHRQPVAGRARLGERAAARVEPQARRSTAVPRSTEGFFVDLAGQARASCAAPATTPARCCATSTRRRSPSSSSARSTRCARPRPPTGASRARSTSSASRSWRRCARRSRRTSTPICAAIRGCRCTVAAKVRIGLARICRDLAPRDAAEPPNDPDAGAEQIEVYAVADGPRARRDAADEHDSLAASISSFSDPMWQVKDRSVAGLRIAALGRHRPEPDARRAGRRAPVGRLRLGAGRRAPPQQGVATTRSRPACRSSPSASSR